MQNIIVKKSQLVSAQITGTPAAGQTYTFLDNAELSSKPIKLYGIEAFTATQLAVDDRNNTVIAAAGAPSVTLTLVTEGNKQTIQNIPVYNLIRSNNGGFIFPLADLPITFTKCFITLNAATSLSANQVVCFNFYYSES